MFFKDQNLEVISKDKFYKLISIYNNDFTNLIFSFHDKIINYSLNIFKRYIEDNIYYIINNHIYFYINNSLKFKNISKQSKLNKKDLNIITLDVETYLDENEKMNIYCICFYV